MPLDHYIPQVHLKKFYSSELGELMYAIRKDDLKEFTPNSKSVCRIEDGSTNSYLSEDRIVEEFLKTIEPKYNESLTKLETESIDQECIYTIAGFVAFVGTCSPAAMRIFSGPIKDVAEISAAVLDSKGVLTKLPPKLGGAKLTELLNNKMASVHVDPKYPQAIGIRQILPRTALFGNFLWEILHNEIIDSPFFTSDYPIAIEETKDPRILNKIIPLSPNLAIRICPDPSFKKEVSDFTFPRFDFRSRTPNRKEVVKINKLIIRSSENMVFYRDNHNWVSRFVAENSAFRTELLSTRIKKNNGTFLLSTQRLVKIEKTSNK